MGTRKNRFNKVAREKDDVLPRLRREFEWHRRMRERLVNAVKRTIERKGGDAED